MQICIKCGNQKSKNEFSHDSRREGKRMARCKVCRKEDSAAWRRANPDKQKACESAWSLKNPEYDKVQSAKWGAANSARLDRARKAWKLNNADRIKITGAAYAKRNPDKKAADGAMHRASKKRATPLWADKFIMGEAYSLAALRTKMLGFEWNVDHIVPLQSKLVCGLHCEANMQVIPGKANKSKGNRRWPEMPV